LVGDEIETVISFMATTVHDRLRDWLVTLGEDNGYEAWTPDKKNNVEVSKFRDAKVDYRPDGVWRKNRQKLVFELAFTEDFRKIIGEMFLSSQIEGFSKIYFIRPTDDEPFWKDIEKFLRYAFRRSDGIVETHHRPNFIIFPRSLEKERKEDEIKERIVETLKRDNWL
jgi:hypothetical protein